MYKLNFFFLSISMLMAINLTSYAEPLSTQYICKGYWYEKNMQYGLDAVLLSRKGKTGLQSYLKNEIIDSDDAFTANGETFSLTAHGPNKSVWLALAPHRDYRNTKYYDFSAQVNVKSMGVEQAEMELLLIPTKKAFKDGARSKAHNLTCENRFLSLWQRSRESEQYALIWNGRAYRLGWPESGLVKDTSLLDLETGLTQTLDLSKLTLTNSAYVSESELEKQNTNRTLINENVKTAKCGDGFHLEIAFPVVRLFSRYGEIGAYVLSADGRYAKEGYLNLEISFLSSKFFRFGEKWRKNSLLCNVSH
tara:strand:- start:58 stop:978 length:921 start_codon:yes stop_codon:yes gene_type:complete